MRLPKWAHTKRKRNPTSRSQPPTHARTHAADAPFLPPPTPTAAQTRRHRDCDNTAIQPTERPSIHGARHLPPPPRHPRRRRRRRGCRCPAGFPPLRRPQDSSPEVSDLAPPSARWLFRFSTRPILQSLFVVPVLLHLYCCAAARLSSCCAIRPRLG
jgi:hypothetical protein